MIQYQEEVSKNCATSTSPSYLMEPTSSKNFPFSEALTLNVERLYCIKKGITVNQSPVRVLWQPAGRVPRRAGSRATDDYRTLQQAPGSTVQWLQKDDASPRTGTLEGTSSRATRPHRIPSMRAGTPTGTGSQARAVCFMKDGMRDRPSTGQAGMPNRRTPRAEKRRSWRIRERSERARTAHRDTAGTVQDITVPVLLCRAWRWVEIIKSTSLYSRRRMRPYCTPSAMR